MLYSAASDDYAAAMPLSYWRVWAFLNLKPALWLSNNTWRHGLVLPLQAFLQGGRGDFLAAALPTLLPSAPCHWLGTGGRGRLPALHFHACPALPTICDSRDKQALLHTLPLVLLFGFACLH